MMQRERRVPIYTVLMSTGAHYIDLAHEGITSNKADAEAKCRRLRDQGFTVCVGTNDGYGSWVPCHNWRHDAEG